MFLSILQTMKSESRYALFSVLIAFSLLFGYSQFSYAQQIERIEVVENKMVTLLGEGFDEDAEDLTFRWEQIGGETVNLSSYTIAKPMFMAPDVKNGQIKVLTFQLTVTDTQNAKSSATVEVVVNPVNHAPVVDAGRDQLISDTVTVVSFVSSVIDPDGDTLKYKWEQISGDPITLHTTNERFLTLTPNDLKSKITEPVTFRLTVTDGFGGEGSDIVYLRPYAGVLRNDKIQIDAGPIQTVTSGETVTLQGSGTTANNAPISYTWVQLTGPGVRLSSIGAANVDFIAPHLADNKERLLVFQLTGYSPSNGWASDLAMVKVLPKNASPIADAGVDLSVRQRSLVELSGTGMDPDNDRIKFSWKQKSGMNMEYYERSPQIIYFFTPLIDTKSVDAIFEFTVTDQFGNIGTDDVVVTITRANNPPYVDSGSDRKVTGETNVSLSGYAFDTDNDPITVTWTQIGGEAVKINADGTKLSFTAPKVASNESKRLVFQLSAVDSEGARNADQVIVYVSPENSAPVVRVGPDVAADENSPVTLTCTANDIDGDDLQINWSSSGNLALGDTSKRVISFNAPNVVVDSKITLTCSASDGRLSGSDSLVLSVSNLMNNNIVADAGPDKIVNEKVKVVLDGSNSHDPEGETLTHAWRQISGEEVKLTSPTSVKASFASPTVANGETKVLVFELRVFDEYGRKSTDTVTITVDPINSPPEAKASAVQ